MNDDSWMFGLPKEAIDRISAQRRERQLKESIDERFERLEAKLDVIIEELRKTKVISA